MVPALSKLGVLLLFVATIVNGVGVFSTYWALCYRGQIGLWQLCAYTGCYWFWDRFEEFQKNPGNLPVWFLGVQILVGLGFALNLLGLICAVVYLCAYHTKAGQILGRVVGVFLLLAAFLELIGICLFIAKMRLDRNAFFYIDPAFTIHSGVGWAFYVTLSGALLLLVVSFMLLWEANSGYHV